MKRVKREQYTSAELFEPMMDENRERENIDKNRAKKCCMKNASLA